LDDGRLEKLASLPALGFWYIEGPLRQHYTFIERPLANAVGGGIKRILKIVKIGLLVSEISTASLT
jgi:hypothetical protein